VFPFSQLKLSNGNFVLHLQISRLYCFYCQFQTFRGLLSDQATIRSIKWNLSQMERSFFSNVDSQKKFSEFFGKKRKMPSKSTVSRSNWNLEVLVLVEGGKPENPKTHAKAYGASRRTKNKLNPRKMPEPVFEPRLHWWEANRLTTAPSLSPLKKKDYESKIHSYQTWV